MVAIGILNRTSAPASISRRLCPKERRTRVRYSSAVRIGYPPIRRPDIGSGGAGWLLEVVDNVEHRLNAGDPELGYVADRNADHDAGGADSGAQSLEFDPAHPQEADTIMGAKGMQDIGGLGSADTNVFTMSNADCLGAAHIVQPAVYADSGFTAILFDVQHEPGNRYTHSIEQAVTSFPSADQALAFVTGQAGKWKACAGQHVTDALKGTNSSWTFGDFVGDVPKIAMRYNRLNARGWTCQRALDAVLNVVIDVKACAYKIDNEGIQAADKIAAKATQ